MYSTQDVEKKIERDIIEAFDTIKRNIPDPKIFEYIEKNPDKKKGKHITFGSWSGLVLIESEIQCRYF